MTEEFWPPRRQIKAPQNKDASEKSEDVGGNWRGCLRDRQPKSCEEASIRVGTCNSYQSFLTGQT